METRRRGREARAGTDGNHSTTANPTRNDSTDPLSNSSQPPSTRTRSRRAIPVQRATRRVRSTRASSEDLGQPEAFTPQQSAQGATPLTLDRPRRSSTQRRSRSGQVPSSGSAQPTPRPSASRKRTRSVTRRQATQSVPSQGASVSAPTDPAAVVSLPATRPAKRPRRASHSVRQSRSASGAAAAAGPSNVGVTSRRTRGMSSSGQGADDRHEETNSRRNDEGPSSVGSDSPGPTTLQGLLRRLGADLSDIFPSNGGTSHTRLQQLRTAISSTLVPPYSESNEEQIDALSELCEFLSVGTEESLVSFSVNLFVGPLVNILRTGANVETKIYAARALTHMMEALPSSSSAIAMNGAASPLCQNLLSIEYIDLAEQSLSALHKLSVDYPQQIVSANGFQAVLSFIDFFSIGMQRVAASTACNLCRLPRVDAMEMISGVLPAMMRLLSSDDQRIRESAVLGFARLAEAFRTSSEKLESMCGNDSGLIEKVFGLIVPSSPPALSPQSYSSALRLLSLLSRGSSALGLHILATKPLIEKLHSRLSSGTAMHSVDCLNLADSLLPDIPELDVAQGSATRSRRRRSVGSSAFYAAIDVKRREELERNTNPLEFFGRSLFDTLMKFYVSSADSSARRLALSIMSKFIAIAPEQVLLDVITEQGNGRRNVNQNLSNIRFCPFVAALLGENSSASETLVGLAMASSALQKVPALRDAFIREGVVHEIDRLASTRDAAAEGESGSLPVADAGGSNSARAGASASPSENQSGGARAHGPPAVNLRDMDSVWNAIAALQRGNSARAGRGDVFGGPQRLPPRVLSELRPPSSQALDSMVRKAAQNILLQHLGANADGSLAKNILQNSTLGHLTAVCDSLASASKSPREEKKGHQALSDFVELLTASDGLTVFEISKSGLMESLSVYLSPSEEKLASARLLSLVSCLNERSGRGAFTSLVELSLGVLASEEKLKVRTSEWRHGTVSPTVSLGLRQLAQPFKLRLKRAGANIGGAGLKDYSHHVVLIEPLATMASVQEFLWSKVCEPDSGGSGSARQRSEGCERTDSDPEAVEGNQESGDNISGENEEDREDVEMEDDRYGIDAMFEVGDEHQDDDEILEEGDAADHNSDASDDDVSSGEEDVIEHDVGEEDDQDRQAPDSLDVDQLGSSLPPFELDHESLGQAPSRGTVPSLPSGTALGARTGSASRANDVPEQVEATFRSYAAALAANISRSGDQEESRRTRANRLSSAGGLTRSGGQTPPERLSFALNDRPLAHDCSILSAIIQSSPDSRGIGFRLWNEVHTLVYSKHVARSGSLPQHAFTTNNSDERAQCTGVDGNAGVRRSQRLQENRDKVQTPKRDEKVTTLSEISSRILTKVTVAEEAFPLCQESQFLNLPESVAAVINVIKMLHRVHKKLSDRVLLKQSTPVVFQGLVEHSATEFVSHKLNAKILRQLSDPLALCGGIIPNWCVSVVREAGFLVPFESRRIFFQSTSLGVSRALHLLQTRTEMAGIASSSHRSRSHRESDARIGRIQRQKVRVHRNRILESAIKVMNMYSANSTVLEVEYFDEVGTGLGPTLEFYTMASRETQRVDLGLWRSNSAKVPKEKEGSVVELRELSGPHARKLETISSRVSSVRRRSRRVSQNNPESKHEELDAEQELSPAYVIPTGTGLFPSCLPLTPDNDKKEASDKSTALFGFVGRLIGKSLIDGRLLDLRFSSIFSRLLLSYCRVIYEMRKESESASDRNRISSNDGFIRGKRPSLPVLDKISRDRVWEIYTSGSSSMKLLEDVDHQLASSLKVIIEMVHEDQGDSISNLCLTFVLPGDDSIELIKNGSDIEVTGKNAMDFVKRVVYHVLYGGVYQQTEALLKGLGELIDVVTLLAFESSELELLVCGPSFEKWSLEFLTQATRCDHGYSHESPAVIYLMRVMSELSEEDQQRFVQFVTGSPALPLGGLRNLHPKLTIVRRTPETGRLPDECLPTVMTCTNYFKLPEYSSLEIAKKQIMYAVVEGQRSFLLS